MERKEFFYFKTNGDISSISGDKVIDNVKDFFIGKDPVILKDTHRSYAYTFTGLVMDDFYTYPRLIQHLINEYNLIGLKVELEITYCNVHYTIILVETVKFTIYASRKVMTFIELNSKFFEEEYLTKFNSVL